MDGLVDILEDLNYGVLSITFGLGIVVGLNLAEYDLVMEWRNTHPKANTIYYEQKRQGQNEGIWEFVEFYLTKPGRSLAYRKEII